MLALPSTALLSAAGLLTGSLASTLPQEPTHVSPAAAAVKLGGTNNNAPFSIIPTHYQQVHDLSSFSSLKATVFTRMRFRMAQSFANRAGATIDVELHVAHSPNGAATMSPTFANNIVAGTDVNVLTRKMVSLPQVPDNAWAIAFPYDRPFVFTGTAHIGWRAIVWGNSNSNASFTYPLDAFSDGAFSGPNGPSSGCRAASGSAAATHTAALGGLGGNAAFTGSSFVAAGGLPAVLTLGASTTSFAGVPLPYDLSPLGAPGCSVRNDVALTLPGTTQPGSAGAVTLNVGIPQDPGLAGAPFHTQFFFLDATANALGLFATNGASHRLAGPPGVSRMYDRGNPMGTMATVTGIAFGLAVGFD